VSSDARCDCGSNVGVVEVVSRVEYSCLATAIKLKSLIRRNCFADDEFLLWT